MPLITVHDYRTDGSTPCPAHALKVAAPDVAGDLCTWLAHRGATTAASEPDSASRDPLAPPFPNSTDSLTGTPTLGKADLPEPLWLPTCNPATLPTLSSGAPWGWSLVPVPGGEVSQLPASHVPQTAYVRVPARSSPGSSACAPRLSLASSPRSPPSSVAVERDADTSNPTSEPPAHASRPPSPTANLQLRLQDCLATADAILAALQTPGRG
ncbi:hypothetical protein AURDEDRAFT_154768 [Auricularia subglabra TFB-10046 SS5]|uniref:Uncharacterized protein n=1 Tax=Auricularia subglabra (strain TFB-10046 / SS5) TaxID=717982 RepID=J0WS76_AURST|nr:hypothetical protein AURDEDRAFT_154768 [Auricularia subglabra TFB-10046 SS5]